MIYTPFLDLRISQLGMGNMRLPTAGSNGPIDVKKAQEIIDYAYAHGVNYFDTAYRYHGGESESFIGKALSQYPRDSWYLATKMPGHMMNYREGKLGFQGYLAGSSISSIGAIFEEQLEKCRVDYFDFYLLHNLCETSFDFYTDKDLAVVEYLLGQKKAGRIRHLGFSAHGRADTIEAFLNRFDCFEFAQIQLNYLDWTLQDAKSSYEFLARRGIPIIAMEPCRGGRLAALNAQTQAAFKSARPDDSIAAWAFRFVKSLPGVQIVLSGMTELDQLKDNIKTFSDPSPMSGQEQELIEMAVTRLVNLVPCTACRYCCEACPKGLDIPKLIALHNLMSIDHSANLSFTLNALKPEELPEACQACGACSKLCPQSIDIPTVLKKLDGAIKSR